MAALPTAPAAPAAPLAPPAIAVPGVLAPPAATAAPAVTAGVTDPDQHTDRHEHHLPDAHQLAQALAQDIAQRLSAAVAARGVALLAVSGGTSPVALFQALAVHPLLATLWPHITVLPVDERCVPFTHPDSNARLVHTHLLQGPAAAAHWVPLVSGNTPPGSTLAGGTPQGDQTRQTDEPRSQDPSQGQVLPPMPVVQLLQQTAEARLATLPWPLDVVMLGMGLDAHTASLFPGAPGLDVALTTPARCAWVLPDPVLNNAQHARITLSLTSLMAARHLCLPLVGDAKHRVYTQALAGATAARPISLLLCQAHNPVAVWLSP
ncbi:MAG: 6-phosphogluconolactonase [Burkholderiales bacterium]|nr:6-phosphogluconolactonase [Burkholderiales bacterium]